jgi:hypothetical protein
MERNIEQLILGAHTKVIRCPIRAAAILY